MTTEFLLSIAGRNAAYNLHAVDTETLLDLLSDGQLETLEWKTDLSNIDYRRVYLVGKGKTDEGIAFTLFGTSQAVDKEDA